MVKAQQAGLFDRVWNSSLGLPQQLLWRIVRVIKEDDIGLFDEKGLADTALLPAVGWADDHRHDVMPDYMAETLGAKKGQSGWKSQIGAAIFTDPLTYLTGGISALGKLGVSATKVAARSPAVGRALRQIAMRGAKKVRGAKTAPPKTVAAAPVGKSLDDVVSGMSPQEFQKVVDGARRSLISKGSRLTADQAKELKFLTKVSGEFTENIGRATALAEVKGIKSADLTIREAMKHTRDRQVAIGIPGLYNLGVKHNVLPGYSSWFKVFGDAVRHGGTRMSKAWLTKQMVGLPGVNKALKFAGSTLAPFRQLRGGWKVGGEARTTIKEAARNMSDSELGKLQHWMSRTTGGAKLIPRLLKTTGSTQGKDKVLETFDKLIAKGESVEEALRQSFTKTEMVGYNESAETIWGRLTGISTEHAAALPVFKSASHARQQLAKAMDTAIHQFGLASEFASTGKYAGQISKTKVGRLAEVYETERKALGAWGDISGIAFETGAGFRKAISRMFQTGEASTFAEKEFTQFLANTARDNDQLEQLTQLFYTKLRKIAGKSVGWTHEDFTKVIGKIMEVEALPGELAASLQLAKINPSNAAKVMHSLHNFTLRQRRSMDVFEQMLKTDGIGTPDARRRMLRAFNDEVFPYLEREGETALGGEFTRLIKSEVEVLKEFTPEQLARFESSVVDGHIIRGGLILDPLTAIGKGKQAARVFQKLRIAGLRAGELETPTIDKALEELRSHSLRPHTTDELVDAAKEMKPILKFAGEQGLTVPEALAVLGRTGKADSRLVPRTAVKPVPLWGKHIRQNWTIPQANKTLSQLGLRLVKDDDGLIRVLPESISERTMAKSYGWKKGPGSRTYTTLRQAMTDARVWSEANPKYVAKYGPKPIEVSRPVSVATADIAALRGQLTVEQLQLLRGKTQVFDDAIMPQALRADHERLTELLRRRALPDTDSMHSPGAIKPHNVQQVSRRMDVRTSDEFRPFFESAGIRIPAGQMSRWALAYARSKLLMREVSAGLKRSAKYGISPEIDPRILAEIEDNLQISGKIVSDLVMDALPKEAQELLDIGRVIQGHSFEAARRAGVWIPGSPVAYISRYFNSAGRQRIAKIIGDIENTDSSLLTRLGVKQAQRFGRHSDAYSIDDLNAIHAEVRKAMNETGASPKWKEFYKGIEAEMETAGIGVAGLRKLKLPWTTDRIQTDPFLGLVQRLGAANQDIGLEQYWESVLSASKTGKNESMMLGGKIVGVIDDTGKTRTLESVKGYTTKSTSRKGSAAKGTGRETVKLQQEASKLEYTPQALILETAEGRRTVIGNHMLDETGYSILDLGAVGDEVALGYKPTLGKSFAQASLRSDLHNSLTRAALQGNQAEKMLGNHVVFGAENMITSAIKTQARVHQVAPPALRAADSINYMIKSFQTIFRLPFHIANVTSGVFQSHLAGASPRNIAAGYADTVKLLWGNSEYTRGVSLLHDMMEVGETVPKILQVLPKSDIQKAARLWGNGSLAKYTDELMGAGVQNMEHSIIKLGNGTNIDVADFIKVAGEMELYGTFASSLTRGSRTVSETLLRMKFATLDPTLLSNVPKKTIEGMTKALGGRPGSLREMSEVFNRTSTALALVREGHPMRRAIEIAKEAHVPYEKLTPFEKNYMKRLSMYYTFPRHYMPWAWTRFAEDPSKMARLSHYVRDQNLISTQEGKANLVMGDYRLDLGRLNANMEATNMVAAFADRIVLPGIETLVPGVNPVDPRSLVKVSSDAGLTGAGGLLAAATGAQTFLPLGRRSQMHAPNMWEDAVRMTWPIKIMAQMMGKLPTKPGTLRLQAAETPWLTKTKGEAWVTSTVIGTGLRKVRPNHELINVQNEYRRQVRSMQLRMAATRDPKTRQRYKENIAILTNGLNQIRADIDQKVFK